jgi:hypothetical protein
MIRFCLVMELSSEKKWRKLSIMRYAQWCSFPSFFFFRVILHHQTKKLKSPLVYWTQKDNDTHFCIQDFLCMLLINSDNVWFFFHVLTIVWRYLQQNSQCHLKDQCSLLVRPSDVQSRLSSRDCRLSHHETLNAWCSSYAPGRSCISVFGFVFCLEYPSLTLVACCGYWVQSIQICFSFPSSTFVSGWR